MGAFLLALAMGVFSASPFGERDVAYAQTQDDNRLQSLSITGVSLSPGFNRDTITYSARVPNTTTSVQVRATTSNRNAMVAIEGQTAATRTITQRVENLVEGTNEVTVVVTPERGGAAQTYTINVYRIAVMPSDDATLASWALHVRALALAERICLMVSPSPKILMQMFK